MSWNYQIHVMAWLSTPSIHGILVELARPMTAGVREIGKYTIHTDAILVSRKAAGHVSPIPLKSHGHLPKILWYVVEGVVKLAHARHGGVDVGADGIHVTTSRHWQRLLLLQHLRGYAGRTVWAHVNVRLERGMRKVWREGERLRMLASSTIGILYCTYLVEAVEIWVEDHAFRCGGLWCSNLLR